MSTQRVIRTKADAMALAAFLSNGKLPATVTISRGKVRSVEQNRLQRLWCREIAEQLGDRTAEEVRGECKLHIGVPLLRDENDRFREAYDRVIRPLDYEAKLLAMMEPLDFPVTRLMTVMQKVRYLDAIHANYTRQGIELTEPDPQFRADLERAKRKTAA